MTDKEIAELRRRMKPDKTSISRIRGCIINEKKEILSRFDESLGLMSEAESEQILAILKKVFSGKKGRTLSDVSFSTAQVEGSEEHKLLMTLRSSSLSDEAALEAFYEKVKDSAGIEGSFAILLASESYDVFSYRSDGEKGDATGVYSYILCAVCPMKLTKSALSYSLRDCLFKPLIPESTLCPPELGFLFPAFDDRTANIYGALYYTRNPSDNHEEFAANVFNTPLAMPAPEQRENFGQVIGAALGKDCSYDVMRSLHGQLCEILEEQKQSKDPEPLLLSKSTLRTMLLSAGMPEDSSPVFEETFDEVFGKNAELNPGNLVDAHRFQVTTPEVDIKLDGANRDMLETRVIDGVKYILVRADSVVEVNGVGIHIEEEKTEG